MSQINRKNALAGETSPYLQQHADNPVEWYPWSDEALARARQFNKPILLSIGYSACHWCHVMAHESFEDEETAALMNQCFVNIKVDREERPDLDKIYQTAHAALTGRGGGWPLTLFLTPDDQVPFFAGTYFPTESRYGLPSFKDILRHIAKVYADRQEDIREQNRSLLTMLGEIGKETTQEDSLNSEPLLMARDELAQAYDPRWGGFGPAPKFPHPPGIERLLRHHAATVRPGQPDHQALEMALCTLRHMAFGGIYDQLGGGFYRYSVDERWLIPHFEKMLYDNALLLPLYSHAWQVSGDPLFAMTAIATADWVIREMQSPEGGFYSSIDADSEGHEGRFYLWTRDGVGALLNDRDYPIFARHYGLDRQPNFESRWHLHVATPREVLTRDFGISAAEMNDLLEQARARLIKVRNQRVRPGRDEKTLTAWNGLMIKGLAVAGNTFGRWDYIQAAEKSFDFIRATLWRDGRLLATYKDGKAHLNAYLDDYAFLLDGALALLQCRWRDGDLDFAIRLADALIERFEDREQGGFFFTSHDHERLIQRTKSPMDDSLPAGMGISALVLGRLGHLLGNKRYLDARNRSLQWAWEGISRHPSAHNTLLLALEEYLQPPETIVIRGGHKEINAWRQVCNRHYAPRRLALAIPADASGLPPALQEKPSGPQVVAYVCEGFLCLPPIRDLSDLEAKLAASEVL
jgi:uncharacterized protein YyaL (SSP411 family)